MDLQEHVLTIFAEELGELALEIQTLQKHVLKAMRFGIDEKRDLPFTNRERIESEWQDLLGSLEILESVGIDLTPNLAAIVKKTDKNESYLEYSRTLGTLKDDVG